jgi:predicted lysophospholipase L1 biosynthesis ABC-type transport system permease subunit
MTSAALQVRRQIALPTRTAAEIAYKSIRLRLGRSLLVTSGIVLAIAFWVSIRTGNLIERGLRAHVASTGDHQLEAKMQTRGVAMGDSDVQTRWLLGLALLVAFVGILNAMLMSVTERFREIGTMKCLGALDGFIVKLFLIESLLQGAAGTVMGIALGLVTSFIAATSSYGTVALRHAPWGSILLSMLLSLLIGVALTVAAALYPAWQAARMQPIEAMRVEA